MPWRVLAITLHIRVSLARLKRVLHFPPCSCLMRRRGRRDGNVPAHFNVQSERFGLEEERTWWACCCPIWDAVTGIFSWFFYTDRNDCKIFRLSCSDLRINWVSSFLPKKNSINFPPFSTGWWGKKTYFNVHNHPTILVTYLSPISNVAGNAHYIGLLLSILKCSNWHLSPVFL